jgi:redox-sensitive bicupin YhaK (pirin superfamily)
MKKSIEKVISRPAQPGMVGDGFRVFNFIPREVSQRRIDPFLMLDFNAAYDFGASEHIRGVDVHPHKGFETVTIAYQGSVAHHDSKGSSGVIHPGDVQWMTAGDGILHKEYHEENFARKGGDFEMVQLWVNLPQRFKSVEAHYQAITQAEMSRVILPDDGGVVNIIAGEFNDVKGSAHTYSPLHVLDFKLKKGAFVKFSMPAAFNTAALVVNGSARFNGAPAAAHSFVLFANDAEEIEIEAGEDAVILLLSGAPLNEPIASYGPFVMNTQEEIVAAIHDFNSGKFGVLN